MDKHDDVIYMDDGSRPFEFKINGIRYKAFASIDYLLTPPIKKETFNFRNFVAEKILDSVTTQNELTVESIEQQSDSFFEQIFQVFLLENIEFHAVYDNIQCDEICEHYVTAYTKYFLGTASKAADTLKVSMENSLAKMSESISAAKPTIDTSFIDSISNLIINSLSW